MNTEPMNTEPNFDNPTIELVLPIRTSYVSLLRQVAGAAAAHADITIDLLDDTKIACSEAAVLLIQHAPENVSYSWRWYCTENRVDVVASAPTTLTDLPDFSDMEGFTWTVLTAVAKDLTPKIAQGNLILTFSIYENA